MMRTGIRGMAFVFIITQLLIWGSIGVGKMGEESPYSKLIKDLDDDIVDALGEESIDSLINMSGLDLSSVRLGNNLEQLLLGNNGNDITIDISREYRDINNQTIVFNFTTIRNQFPRGGSYLTQITIQNSNQETERVGIRFDMDENREDMSVIYLDNASLEINPNPEEITPQIANFLIEANDVARSLPASEFVVAESFYIYMQRSGEGTAQELTDAGVTLSALDGSDLNPDDRLQFNINLVTRNIYDESTGQDSSDYYFLLSGSEFTLVDNPEIPIESNVWGNLDNAELFRMLYQLENRTVEVNAEVTSESESFGG